MNGVEKGGLTAVLLVLRKEKLMQVKGKNMIKHRDHSNLSGFAYGNGVLSVSLLLTTRISLVL